MTARSSRCEHISAHACFAITPCCKRAAENYQVLSRKISLENSYGLSLWWQLRTITFFDVPSCSSIFMHFDKMIIFRQPIPVEPYVRGCPDSLTCGYRHLISSKCMMWWQAGMTFPRFSLTHSLSLSRFPNLWLSPSDLFQVYDVKASWDDFFTFLSLSLIIWRAKWSQYH